LGLSFNKLSQLPESIVNLDTIEKLYLGFNNFKDLPESMKYSENEEIRSAYDRNIKKIMKNR
jgi:Leucine-rich repeat (LRR) protein